MKRDFKVNNRKDDMVEKEFNLLLEATGVISRNKGDKWKNLSLGETIELVIK